MWSNLPSSALRARWALIPLLLLMLVAACGAPAASAPTAPNGTRFPQPGVATVIPSAAVTDDLGGRLVLARDREFYTMLPTGQDQKRLPPAPEKSYVRDPAWSPDGSLIAYSFSPPPKQGEPGGADLYVMNADGSNRKLLVAHDKEAPVLESPSWSPDGQTVYFSYLKAIFQGTKHVDDIFQIEKVGLASGKRTPVLSEGGSPHLSDDGKLVTYIKTDTKTFEQSIWVANSDGSNPRLVVPQASFQAFFAPKLSPDGKLIAFGAVGGPTAANPSPPSPAGPLSWLGPRTAYAHDVPWEVWIVGADGKGLRRLTQLQEDQPSVSWSPTGKNLAFAGARGVYVLSVDGKRLSQPLKEDASQLLHAQLDWSRQ